MTSITTARGLAAGVSRITGVSIAAAGSGYTQGDVVTVSGGTFLTPQAYVVTDVTASGAVARLRQAALAGVASSKPSNPAATSGGSGTGLTLTLTWEDNALPDSFQSVLLQAETQGVRWRDDGVDPTASVGFLLSAGDSLFYDMARVRSLRVIEAAAGAKLNVAFYG